MSASKIIFNQHYLSLLAAFLFTLSNISFADSSTATKNMPVPGTQEAPAQEMLVEKTPGKVARAIFTSEIIDREPANDLTEMSNISDRIYFFTDLRNLAGQIITHRWEYNNAVMAEVKFKVGEGARWRVYSSKNLLPEWEGVWTVFVTDENEQLLKTSEFNYSKAPETVTMPDAAKK